ncbi:MAG TPA: Isoquinoline 1-oxidoreductase subunit, partial [Methylocystis sp.]
MRPKWRRPALISALVLVNVAAAGAPGPAGWVTGSNTLASPESFSAITDINKRSAAYFTELSKVLTNPRCTNCHPASDRPRQGDTTRLHQPPVFRGK